MLCKGVQGLPGHNKIETAGILASPLPIARSLSNQHWNATPCSVMRRFRFLALAITFSVQTVAALGQLSTGDHLAEPGFWPTQSQPSREGFVGPETCARCHAARTATQTETPMARNLMPAAVADILHLNPALTFSVGKFQYRIDTDANRAAYSVTNGNQRISYPLAWAFGTGRVAQSYLFKKEDGGFYEARVTFFTRLKALDFTPWRSLLTPSSLAEAMYRPVGSAEVQQCFACHSTASNAGGQFDEKRLIPGVTCEACHGPGANHAKSMDASIAHKPRSTKQEIYNPEGLPPQDAVDFCGACHGTFWDTKLSGTKGVSTTRSAPYRLVTSKCWGNGDSRLTCTACHDPHQQLETDAAAYDHVCRSCHVIEPKQKATISHPGAPCPKAVSNCTNCHMEKVYIPEMHANFTDHRIRIVKPGEAFPE